MVTKTSCHKLEIVKCTLVKLIPDSGFNRVALEMCITFCDTLSFTVRDSYPR